MSRFLDLMRLSLPRGKIINVPDFYLHASYVEHRAIKGLSAPIAVARGTFFVRADGCALNVREFARMRYRF